MHKRVIMIEFDPVKSATNFRKHRVSFSDAEQVLNDQNAQTFDDPDAENEQRLVTLGMDSLGRILIVVHSTRCNKIRLISARKASPGEMEQYYA